ncbi:MAG TPA: hypothetical protein VK195_21005, partial [Burkholderiaceae bacterium]|nr:hypothetical protein [Burkholderiaceae bacterium]
MAARALLLGLLALLDACGGGGGSPPLTTEPVGPAVQGRLYPAVEGVVIGEYGADGELIQSSSATLQDGSFTFARALSGVRLSGTEAGRADTVPVTHSARLAAQSAIRVEVTPLSTWYDQLLVHGLTPAAARDRIIGLVRPRCTVKDLAPDLGYLHADTLDTSDQHDWLLSALAAYLAAARGVGLGPEGDFEGWQGLLGRRTTVLTELCEYAATVSSKDWRETLWTALNVTESGKKPRTGTLDLALAGARAQVLALMARQVQLLEFPEQAPLLADQRTAAEVPPLRLHQELTMALY